MTIKAGNKYIGNNTGVIFTVLFSSEQYVVVENDEPCMIGDSMIHPKGRQHCIHVDQFTPLFSPYTPPREYWTYSFKTQNNKLLNSPLIFETQAEACEHYNRCHKYYVGAPKHKWAHFYKLDNEISDFDLYKVDDLQ